MSQEKPPDIRVTTENLPKRDYDANVVIGVSCIDTLNMLFVQQLLNIQTYYKDTISAIIFDQTKPVDFSRNILFSKFLIEYPKATHLLLLDTDVLIQEKFLSSLLEYDLPAVSGMIFQKMPPHYPLMTVKASPRSYRFAINWGNSRHVKVNSVGFGLFMLRRDLIQTVRPPWCTADEGGLSEDYIFCQKIEDTGYPIIVDTTVQTGHLGYYLYTANDFQRYQNMEIARSQAQLGDSHNQKI